MNPTNEVCERKVLLLNPLSPELNPICYLLALLAHHFLHVSRIRVISLTLRLLMSYICHLGFESHRGHGYLSVVSVVCCQVEVSATS
jgi:transposase